MLRCRLSWPISFNHIDLSTSRFLSLCQSENAEWNMIAILSMWPGWMINIFIYTEVKVAPNLSQTLFLGLCGWSIAQVAKEVPLSSGLHHFSQHLLILLRVGGCWKDTLKPYSTKSKHSFNEQFPTKRLSFNIEMSSETAEVAKDLPLVFFSQLIACERF